MHEIRKLNVLGWKTCKPDIVEKKQKTKTKFNRSLHVVDLVVINSFDAILVIPSMYDFLLLETMQVPKGLDMHEQFQGLQASSSLHHNPLQSQTLEWECL